MISFSERGCRIILIEQCFALLQVVSETEVISFSASQEHEKGNNLWVQDFDPPPKTDSRLFISKYINIGRGWLPLRSGDSQFSTKISTYIKIKYVPTYILVYFTHSTVM